MLVCLVFHLELNFRETGVSKFHEIISKCELDILESITENVYALMSFF